MAQPPKLSRQGDGDLSSALALLEQLHPALVRGDRAKQNEIVERLIELHAPMGDQWQALANLVLSNGEISLARKAIDLFVEARRGEPVAQYQKAALLEQSGSLREAYELMLALPENLPNPAANAFSRGTAALFLGEAAEARRQLDRAVRLQPQSGAAWLSLAMSLDFAEQPGLADRVIAAERGMGGVPPAQQAAYYYAKGKAHVETGEFALAFAAFSRGGREMKSLSPYDRRADRQDAEEIVRGYSAEGLHAIARRQRVPTNRSIFVTGLPRSGTTLIEQILTSHSAVSDGGEINRLPLLAREVQGHSFTALRHYADGHDLAAAAHLWHHWLDERFPGSARIVDKTLNTTRLIGLPAALLPEAPLIWLTRDPLDRAWSCFRTFFPTSMAWSYDLEDIAFHFRVEDQLLRQWQEILSDRLLVIPYESLIASPEVWIRRILSHCGLDEEPAVFASHKNHRTVTTASVMQVRRPLNRQGIGSAEPFREFLQPFIEAYYG